MSVSLLILTWSGSIFAQAQASEPLILFEDRSESAGIHWRQEKPLSVCWVDFNRDGLDDLYIQSHNDGNSRLYKNMGNGRFEDVIDEVIPDRSTSDTHGAVTAHA